MAVGDLNGDQVPDVVVGNFDSDDAAVFLGGGDGTFGWRFSMKRGGSDGRGDRGLESRQVPDLAVANYYSNDGTVHLGAGDGTFHGDLLAGVEVHRPWRSAT